jgi:hypothetical protein
MWDSWSFYWRGGVWDAEKNNECYDIRMNVGRGLNTGGVFKAFTGAGYKSARLGSIG